MSGVALVVEVALALGAVAFVGYPLLQERWADDEPEEMPEELESLYSRKESTYSALKELEFDYKTGKLSDSDYHELDTRFRAEAVEILEAIEQEENPALRPETPAVRAEPAAGVSVAAAGLSVAAAAVPGGTVAVAGPAKRGRARNETAGDEPLVCLACGRVNPAGAKFCGACGSALATAGTAPGNGGGGGSAAAVCVECGGVLKAGQRFCGGCGAEARA